MILALDIGNSFIKTGIFSRGELVYTKIFKHDELSAISFDGFTIDSCAISSVVPEKTESIKKIISEKFGTAPFNITNNSLFNLKMEYSTPGTLGIDRICGAEGAVKLFNSAGNTLGLNDVIISIDFGTATTINLVKYPDIFAGGIISPGIRMMFEALNKNTSQLPGVSFEDYKNVIGDSTNSSIASGVLNATAGLIERTRSFLTEKLTNGKVYTFITGGNAQAIMPHLTFDYKYDPNLVLHGIYSVFIKNNPMKADL